MRYAKERTDRVGNAFKRGVTGPSGQKRSGSRADIVVFGSTGQTRRPLALVIWAVDLLSHFAKADSRTGMNVRIFAQTTAPTGWERILRGGTTQGERNVLGTFFPLLQHLVVLEGEGPGHGPAEHLAGGV